MTTDQPAGTDGESTLPVCPFCGGKPFAITNLPGADAIGCETCGAVGPAIQGAKSNDRFHQACKRWSARGGVGNVRVAHVKPGTSADTCITAEVLNKEADKLRDNEYGSVDAAIMFMFDSHSKRLGIVIHRFDKPSVKAILEQVLAGMAEPGQAKQPILQTNPGGRIIVAR